MTNSEQASGASRSGAGARPSVEELEAYYRRTLTADEDRRVRNWLVEDRESGDEYLELVRFLEATEGGQEAGPEVDTEAAWRRFEAGRNGVVRDPAAVPCPKVGSDGVEVGPSLTGWVPGVLLGAGRRWAVGFATLLALVAIALQLQSRYAPWRASTTRSGGEETLRSLVPADEPLPRGNAVLLWSPGPEGTTYRLVVTTEDLRVLAEPRDLEVPAFRIPADLLRDLEDGAALHWMVEMRLPEGREVSRTFISTLGPRAEGGDGP